jgi:hypothetical protein
MNDLSELFNLLAEEKRKKKAIEEKLKASIKEDLNGCFAQLGMSPSKEEIPVIVQEIIEDISAAEIPALINQKPAPEAPDPFKDVKKYLGNAKSTHIDPQPDPVAKEFKAVTEKIRLLEQSITKIVNTGPGSGEVNLRWLDDVDRASIYDMRYMRYNATSKKFEFAEVNPHDIVYTTHLVTTSTYNVDSDDYYVGVNYAGPCTITLPTSPSSGRMLIIKDESGQAETNPITVAGTVDNDAGGFIIQINNGATQLIYRDGWRII